MSKDLSQIVEQVHRAEVIHHGEKLILPEHMTPQDAITVLQERIKHLQQEIVLNRTYDAFPWDGAVALGNVLKSKYGWVPAMNTQSFFGPEPPAYRDVAISHDTTIQVLWGQVKIPGTSLVVICGVNGQHGRACFSLACKGLRMHESTAVEIFLAIENELATNSIYRGKAIKLQLTTDKGQLLPMPMPTFIDTTKLNKAQLILPRVTQDAVETNLFTPIERAAELAANNLPIKRGVMLGGVYGVGKTLTAMVAARLATENNITFIYISKADELAEAIEFAKRYQSKAAVVFCEDIDRSMQGQERTAQIDKILNTIDGIDSKHSNLIVVLTTNNLEGINQAMLRPGRLDSIIEFTPPDSDAVCRLLKWYGKDLVPQDQDLHEVGTLLEGNIPAVVEEVVKRAKLAQLKMQERGRPVEHLSKESLVESAQTMRRQLELLQPRTTEKVVTFESALTHRVGTAIEAGLKNAASDILAFVRAEL